jgi:hypothetical protein
MPIKPAFTYSDGIIEVLVKRHTSGDEDFLIIRSRTGNDLCFVHIAELDEFIAALRSLVPEAERPKVYRGPAEALS